MYPQHSRKRLCHRLRRTIICGYSRISAIAQVFSLHHRFIADAADHSVGDQNGQPAVSFCQFKRIGADKNGYWELKNNINH